jgi:two-component system, NtrC family, C4-dicarboxylate transport sensor histidine kinase DctB
MLKKFHQKHRPVLRTGMLCTIWLVLALPFLMHSSDRAQLLIYADLQRTNDSLTEMLENQVERYRLIQASIAKLQLARNVLLTRHKSVIDRANRFLYQSNQRLESEAIFILNKDGTVIASSNYATPESYVAKSFAFRPYFIIAANNGYGEYYAQGTITQRRGYYFSAPIKADGKVIGAAVVKVSLEDIFQTMALMSHDYLLTGVDGVIFSSSKPIWNYSALYPLSDSIRLSIQKTQRYGSSTLSSISQHSVEEALSQKKLTLKLAAREQNYFVVRASITNNGWSVYTLSPVTELAPALITTFAFYSLLFWLLVFIWLYWRKRVEMQHHIESQNTVLEQRVEKLTGGLRKSNQELQELVEHYRKNQEELCQTQDQLVRAAKLATLGEMSASMNHELNQPLSALRIYIENCLLLRTANKYEMIGKNLEEMNLITKTMAKIISSFKVFSRNTPPAPRNSPLKGIIDSTMIIVEHLLKKFQINLHVEYTRDDIEAYCEPVQLEQVLVNLITNAIDALSDTPNGEIQIKVKNDADFTHMSVFDNGPGLSDEKISHIFEPFFTTKTQGLGLGLAISKRIIDAHGGSLLALALPAGTCFEISLPGQNRGIKDTVQRA